MQSEKQTASRKIWTLVAESISYDDISVLIKYNLFINNLTMNSFYSIVYSSLFFLIISCYLFGSFRPQEIFYKRFHLIC